MSEPSITLDLGEPPPSVNTSALGGGWKSAQGRRKKARGVVRDALWCEAARRGVPVLDMPRQAEDERWKLRILWRSPAPVPDSDNAAAALKPYIDACHQKVRRRGSSVAGEAPILIDDSPARLERELVIEEGPPSLVFEYSVAGKMAARAPRNRTRKPKKGASPLYQITTRAERREAPDPKFIEPATWIDTNTPIHKRLWAEGAEDAIARAIRRELDADGLHDDAELIGTAELCGLPIDQGCDNWRDMLREVLMDWAAEQLGEEDRATLMDEVHELVATTDTPSGLAEFSLDLADCCKRAGRMVGTPEGNREALVIWLAGQGEAIREEDVKRPAPPTTPEPSPRPSTAPVEDEPPFILGQTVPTQPELFPPPTPDQLADELAAVDAELKRLAPTATRIAELERRRRRLEREVGRAFVASRRAS